MFSRRSMLRLLGATLFASFSNPQGAQAQAFVHLMLSWIVLGAMILILGFVIAWFLRRKDVRV